MDQVFTKLPSVMSLKRTIAMTDGIMSSLFSDGSTKLVDVTRHGIRGTQNMVKDALSDEYAEVSNIQTTDTAKIDPNAAGLRVEFGIRFLPLVSSIDSCAPGKNETPEMIKQYRDSLKGFAARAAHSDGLKEVSLRYARNIANGRWLWRNRTMAETVAIKVSVGDKEFNFDALSIPLNTFSNYSQDERNLADVIANGLSGTSSSSLKVSADLDFGINGAVEVFPSQNYINGKPKGFARSLYKYGAPDKVDATNNNRVGYAAIRDQKIGNALRTFDTWYSDFEEVGMPIPIEPNGASLDAQRFFRKNNSSAFKLFLRLNQIDPNTEQGMFCIANMIRGAVYSESDKKDKAKENTVAADEEGEI
jgi:CRISPR-associated protein Csy3